MRMCGKGAAKLFANEAGGHRWQRIPPTEKKGRVHTSTITVAVLHVPEDREMVIADKDLKWAFCRSGGSGGQHVNKTDSAVQLTHIPTGVQVRCESERSQTQNKMTALSLLRARLVEAAKTEGSARVNGSRKSQVGSGMRGDKVVTLRMQDDVVTHHVTGRRTTVTRYMRGYVDDLV